MQKRNLFLVGLLTVLLFAACNNINKIQKSSDYNYKLKKADEFYVKKKFNLAQQLYEDLFPVFKGTGEFESLYYKYAYCFYYQKLYAEAENLFKGYLEVFPNSSRAEEVDYMRAYCFYKQSPKIELEQVNTMKAMGMMQSFINTHPNSPRVKDATEIIDQSRMKLEQKDYRSAKLYYNLGHYRAAALAFTNLLNSYPETVLGDEYKLMTVKSYYKFAKMSVEEKQLERFEKVLEEYQDFADRFPDSQFLKEAEEYNNLSKNQIKALNNEQVTSSAKR